MCRGRNAVLILLALSATVLVRAQVIEFESNGLRYHALTRNGLTIMLAQLPRHIRDYSVLQVAVSNGGNAPQIVKPEDFLFIRDDGAEIASTPARAVVHDLVDRAGRGDVAKLITAYENSIYGNPQYKATNGYEQRRQSAMAEFGSTRVRAAAAASAIALVQTKLAPGQSTDGAVFYATSGKPLGTGLVRVRAAGAVFEIPLLPLSSSP